MPYVTPTPASFKARYPEFTPVSDALIQLELDDAISAVGDTWVEKDRARAQMLLVAHRLTLAGEPGRTASGQSSAGTGLVKRRKVGDVETEFASTSSSGGGSGSLSGYSSTVYGQEFAMLLRMNFAGPIAV